MKRLKLIYEDEYRKRLNKIYGFTNVEIGKGHIEGHVKIGEYTYINNGYRIVTGHNSTIMIGRHCAIGRNFLCASRTHDKRRPVSDEKYDKHLQIESDISIGEGVWIGDNVVVREGIIICDNAIIGANSVVTRDVRSFEIVGGVPAKHIAYNTQHYRYRASL